VTGVPALDKAISYGERGVGLDPSSSFAAYHLAIGYMFRNRLGDAEAVLLRALRANPYDADVLDRLGVIAIFEGRPQQGVEILQRVLKIDPFHRSAIYALLARGYVMQRAYDKAAEELRLCFIEAVKYRVCYEVAAVYYVETGDIEKARGAVATLRQLDPKFTLTNASEQLPFKNKADQDRFLSAFRKAGMPES
jgi:adenylate cyclase